MKELEQLERLKRFEITSNSMEGKWFAESYEDAVKWGELLDGGKTFYVIEIELLDYIVENLFRLNLLDGIGPARYAELEDLSVFKIISVNKIESI